MPDPTTKPRRPVVQLQDSPLAVGGPVPEAARSRITRGVAQLPQPGSERGGENEAPAAAAKAAQPDARRAPTPEPVEEAGRLEAPAIDEPTARLAVDIPESLVDAFARMAEQLRTRGGRRVSQKALSNREILAALLWDALGDASHPGAVDAMDARLRRYRATQHEQAAAEARRDA